MNNELFIIQSNSQTTEEKENTFIIKKELNSISSSEFDQAYSKFVQARPTEKTRLPLYRILWKRFTAPQAEHRSRLIHLVLLYKRLSARIESDDIDRLRCADIDKKYHLLVEDVAENNNIKVDKSFRSVRLSRLFVLITSLIGLSIFIIDQIISLLIKPVFNLPERLPAVFVPSMGRFHTMDHVLNNAKFNYSLVIPPMTVAWFRSRSNYPRIASHNPIPINTTIRLKTIYKEFQLLFTEIIPEFKSRRFDDYLSDFIYKEFDINLYRCVGYEIDEVLNASLLRSFLYFVLTDNFIKEFDCEKLVVNSAAPMGKAMMAAGKHNRIEIFHLRHSIVTGYTPDPPFDSTEFVEGSAAINHLEDSEYVSDTTNFVNTGYEYLNNMYESGKGNFEPVEPVTIFIGTQPFDDTTRIEFIEETLAGIDSMAIECQIVIKIHPDESPSFYREIVEQKSTTVVTGNLREHLQEADLAITINSNVGLEAMLMDTPCVCINKWEPIIRTQPYALYCPVPILKSSEEIRNFFMGLDIHKLKYIYDEQQDSLPTNFRLEPGAAQRIASYINDGYKVEYK